MFSKTIIGAAVVASFASQTIAYSLPASWNACFGKFNVTSEESLCQPALQTGVTACIAAAGNSSSAAAYSSWLCGYCSLPACAANATSSSTVTLSTTSVVTLSTSYPVTTPVSPVTPVPTGTGVPPSYGNGTTSATVPYYPTSTGGYWSHSSYASAPSSSPTVAPYTGGAAGLSAAGSMVALIGAVAAGLVL